MAGRFFNTTGPCRPDRHYMLPAAARLGPVRQYIEREQYVVLHAARQSGKTTALQALARELLVEDVVAPAVLSCEVGGAFADIERAEPAILDDWRRASGDLAEAIRPPPWPSSAPGSRVGAALAAWSRACPRPLVLFLDEVDALRDEVLVSFLRQLRSGFSSRPDGFPQSLVLVGLPDVREYLVAAGSRLGTASPFNVKVESIRLEDFDVDEVRELLAQHTADTGQLFEPSAVERVYELGRGQPWVTNALAAEVVDRVLPDRARAVTAEAVDEAARRLISRRDTHLDSLIARIAGPRVRAVLEPLVSDRAPQTVPEDDRQFAIDLGLVRRHPEGGLEIANPLYRALILRALAGEVLVPQVASTWLGPDVLPP